MGSSDSFVNARIGAPRRSGPNDGNAKACRPSSSDAAAPSSRAAVKAPWPPRPCHSISIMDSPLRIFARWSCKYTAAHERGRLRARPHAVKLPQLGRAPLAPRAFRLFPHPRERAMDSLSGALPFAAGMNLGVAPTCELIMLLEREWACDAAKEPDATSWIALRATTPNTVRTQNNRRSPCTTTP